MLIEFFTNETDLGVADRLSIAISDLSKEDFRPRDFNQILTWWNDNHVGYTNWPLATLNQGRHEFGLVHYPQAAEAFEQVLKLDPSADMSRAYAIACCCEMGQTNQAVALAKDFKDSSARWAEWAKAKTELETGSVSNATVIFFNLTTNNPCMPELPNQYSHIYRHVDWDLFNQLKETKTN